MSSAGENKEYIFANSTMSSARLTYQHQMLLTRTGYLMSPKIVSSIGLDKPYSDDGAPLEILDLATGNGIWLTELAYELSQMSKRSIRYTGLDIASGSFPPENSWPTGTTFATYDIFADVPEQYVAKFNVVHVRLIVSLLWQNLEHRVIALNNMKRMLKPGGWLQWQDGPTPTIATYDINSDGTCTFHKELHPYIAANDRLTGFQKNSMWMNSLDDFVAMSGGMDRVEAHWVPMRLDRAKYENDLSIWTIEDAKIAILKMRIGTPEQGQEIAKVMDNLLDALSNGRIQTALRTVVVVGQKAQ